MGADRYGMDLTTDSNEARDAYVEAFELVLARQDGALELAQRAIEADPSFAMAWALLGGEQRVGGDMLAGDASIQRAIDLSAGASDRERSHLATLGCSIRADVVGFEAGVQRHLNEWPRDALMVLQGHFLYNILVSRPDRDTCMLALDEKIAPAYGDDWFMGSELAFAAEENGEYSRARDLAEGSLAANSDNSIAAHTLAHVYLETADLDAGASWLSSWLSAWDRPSNFACHLTWHLALLHLAADHRPEVDRLLVEITDYAGRFIGALSDGSSLCWRLKVDGVASNLPWERLAALPDNPGFTFGNAHHALALAGANDAEGLRGYGQTLDNLAKSGHPTAGRCAELARSLAEFVDGKTESAADRLVALLPQMRSFGGSHAQTEVFEDVAIAAVECAGRRTQARDLLVGRLARRPSPRDDRWLARLS